MMKVNTQREEFSRWLSIWIIQNFDKGGIFGGEYFVKRKK